MGESLQAGEAEARAALEDIKMDMTAAVASKLETALSLAKGELKTAIEHALADLNAGKPDGELTNGNWQDIELIMP